MTTKKTRITLAVTVEVDADWGDPWNVAQHVLEVALSGDRRGIHLPHDVTLTTGPDLDIEHDYNAAITSIETLSSALHNGTIRLVTNQHT